MNLPSSQVSYPLHTESAVIESLRKGQVKQGQTNKQDEQQDVPNEEQQRQHQQSKRPWIGNLWQSLVDTMVRHVSFVGPGLIASVAYCDPGNWATDMEAGSRFGYHLLFTVLLSGLFAVLLQVLCTRLGTVTGLDLASQTRRLILGIPAEPGPLPDMRSTKMRLRYWGILIPLYIINEGAIIATELAELIGSAIALQLLFPKLPLWGGVLLTSADVFLVLVLYRPSAGVRLFEMLIGALVLIVLACFIVLLVRVQPDWGDVFYGYVPTSHLVSPGSLYVSISILGATIMPHSLVLGSHFATIDRLEDYAELRSTTSSEETADNAASSNAQRQGAWRKFWHNLVAKHMQVPESTNDDGFWPQKPVSLRRIQLHLSHASWDIAICLVMFAITINSAILIVASAAFYYGHNKDGDTETVGDLFQAFDLLRKTVGKTPAILFAIALLAAGQSSSITVTLAGQLISEGFIHWRFTPFMRRLLTRMISIIPSMVVAAVVGRRGMDTMLVASQVVLSMALPFVSMPLLLLTNSSKRMEATIVNHEVDRPASRDSNAHYGSMEAWTSRNSQPLASEESTNEPQSEQQQQQQPSRYPGTFSWRRNVHRLSDRLVRWFSHCGWGYGQDVECPNAPTYSRSFHNAWYTQVLAWAVFLLICIADVFVLYQTIKDPSSA